MKVKVQKVKVRISNYRQVISIHVKKNGRVTESEQVDQVDGDPEKEEDFPNKSESVESESENIQEKKSIHIEKEERVAEQVDEVDGDPAEEEDDPDAPEKLFRSRHSKSLLVIKNLKRF